VFVIAALAICWFAEHLHRARRQAREHAERSDQLLAELRSSREHLQLHVDNSEQLVWLKDGQGRYVFANRAACAAAGVDCAEMIGKTDADVLRPERAAAAAAAEQEVRRTMAPVTQDSVQIGDRVFRVVRFPVALPDGQVGIGATGVDITELTASQARLTQLLAAAQERERVLQSVLDHVPEGITVAMGAQARIVLVSRHGAELMQGPVAGLTDIDAITVDPAGADLSRRSTRRRARNCRSPAPAAAR
jgi:two-component system, sensor histidine kinase and response regulator